jgi:hypothetical protein
VKTIETFSGSEAIKEIKQCAKKGASEGLYDPSPRRLRVPLELATDLLLGNVGVDVEGVGNLLEATEKTEENKGVIFATSHLTDVDVSTVASVVSKFRHTGVTVASTNMGLWHQRIPYKLVGMDNFFQVPYGRDLSVEKDAIDNKYALPFNSDDYLGLQEKITDSGLSVITAAHNPMSNIGIKNDGELPEKAGKLAPHLSLATGATIIPVLMQVEGQKRNPNQLNDNAIHLKWLLGKKVVRVVFGETIKPSPDEVEAYANVSREASYSKAAREEQCRILETFGGKAILGYMRDKYDPVLAA